MPPRQTILVVEDDIVLLDLLAWVLRQGGYQVEEALDGEEAIRAVDRPRSPDEPLDLVLLDLQLPLVSGLDVLEHLAQHGNPVPVVVASAYDHRLDNARAAGAQATISKPFALAHLLTTVKRCCAV
jgi:CheY-like chemotaxis protein